MDIGTIVVLVILIAPIGFAVGVYNKLEQFPNNTIQVFDRWSSLVYQMQGYNNIDRVWEGESNKGVSTGKLPTGTYFYLINLGDGTSVIDGFVELKRE